MAFQRKFARVHKTILFPKDELLKTYRKLVLKNILPDNKQKEKVLRLKQTRSLSGIVVVSVLTKPYDCPGKCLYCPEEKGVPKSYLSDEPAVMRAITCNYDPYKQTFLRLKALQNTGHDIGKINIRIIGGTWSFYPKPYQTWFIKKCIQACNNFSRNEARPYFAKTVASACSFESAYEQSEVEQNMTVFSLERFQTINETSNQKVVEISIETRQDYINKKELLRLRKLGVTKVELGIQSIYDDVLKLNNRGHDLDTTIDAIKILKNTGFKVSYQIMLNLPGSNKQRDLEMVNELFANPDFKPDYLKIYPLALVKSAPIYRLYKKGQYKPYTLAELKSLLKKIKQVIPYYCRVERVIRDIPSQHIVEGGSKVSNLRQIVIKELEEEGNPCHCIRCREVRDQYDPNEKIILFREDYESSDGREIFLSYETNDRKKLYSILRLRFNRNKPIFTFLNNSAIVREIHTYGDQTPTSKQDKMAAQHKGLGQKMLKEAERIAKEEFEVEKIAVISGIGVRGYFKKQGYKLEKTYMIKDISKIKTINSLLLSI